MQKLLAVLLLISLLSSCKHKKSGDTIFFNGIIYTLNKDSLVADAMVVTDGKIVATGKQEDLQKIYDVKASIDLQGKPVYPGFIDAHCHFYGYGSTLTEAQLTGTKSWQEVVETVQQYATGRSGWIIGRGWDQNDWQQKSFPSKEKLDELFPDQPVFLQRIDGHACIVNQQVLDLAHIDASTIIPGGQVILSEGQPTGVLLDNAMDSVSKLIPVPSNEAIEAALLQAQVNCFKVGLTTVADAGLTRNVVEIIDTLQQRGKLMMRVYAMLTDNDENKNYYFKHGPYKTDRLNVRAFKFYADGALGSRGALLLKPYTDDSHSFGIQLNPVAYFEEQAKLCLQHGFQMCTHAIGDSANRMMLHVYGKVLGGANDKRWRIEHCQVVAPDDFELFQRYTIIPSVQPTHATSDMYWATDRLGVFRIRGAYAYHDLMMENGWIAAGSDFPIEDINPLFGFYAAVVRKDQKGFPEDGFQVKNALTRSEALYAMTIWAAAANFEEDEKGSLEPGKFADFVVLDDDILKIPDEQLFKVIVLSTWIGGEKVY
ncbi:MAG: amidohydrolase [Chitinophagales bacterium]|nr:amidohydrolase [Chitinophagales bacterium]